MNSPRRAAILCAMALSALSVTPPALAGGAARVSFVEPARFTDLARDERESRDVQAEMARHIERLAERHLPDGRSLQIDVLDIDRAGTLLPWRGRADLVRVMRGGADWPAIRLRYVLRSGEQVLAQGEERLQDMDYLRRIGTYASSDPLRHEKRLLDRWFVDRLPVLGAPG